MATYKQIQEYAKEKYGIRIKTCWIAHMKEVCGLQRKDAPNRLNQEKRKYPCPEEKKEIIIEGFKHFEMI